MDSAGEVSGASERLQKALARAGLGSRRSCEELIAAGRVTVDGAVARLGCRIDPDSSVVAVDGMVIGLAADLVHYLLNKPAGVVTTAADPQGRPIVTDLVPDDPRVFPVGRLDAATEGLLVLTNDGQLAHRLTHPSFGVAKEYLAHVAGRPSRAAVRSLRDGVDLDDGPTAPAKAVEVSPGLLRIEIHEGRNRQIRRMCEAVGCPVRRLVRTRIGPIVVGSLPPGQWRRLEPPEVRALERAATALDPDAPGSATPALDPVDPGPVAPSGPAAPGPADPVPASGERSRATPP